MKIFIFAIFLLLYSCINNKSKPYHHYYDSIIGDCINDSLFSIIDLKMKNLGWEDLDTIERNGNYRFKYSRSYKEKYKDMEITIYNKWSFEYNKNKFIALNHWYEEYGFGPSGKNNLSTDKKDTLFWNVINFLNQYCELRDTTIVIIHTPALNSEK